MPRPWLFLDLDGVLSPVPPQGADPDEIPSGHMTWDGAIYHPMYAWPLTLEPTRRQGGWGRLRHKTAVIGEHLRRDPRPFAWADDFHARRNPPPPVRELQLDCLILPPQCMSD